MIIQCVSCGYSKFLNPKGNERELQKEVNDTINSGWRYAPSYDGYVCGNCKQDPLHEMFVGKIRKVNKEKSNIQLRKDFSEFIGMLSM